MISDSADVIVGAIADNLFSQWQQGVYSAYDVRRISERILEMLQEKNKNMDAEALSLEDGMPPHALLRSIFSSAGLFPDLCSVSPDS